MIPKIITYIVLIGLLVGSLVTPGVARIFDKIIAYVNDDVITQRQLDTIVNQRALELQHVYHFSKTEALKAATEQRAALLDKHIREMLLVEAALTLKIEVTDSEVEQYIQDVKKRYQIETDDEFKKLLNREGRTLIGFREQCQRNLMTEKLVRGRILPRLQVRDSEVQKFFEENRDQLPTKSDKVRLRYIAVDFKPSEADRKATYVQVNKAVTQIRTDNTQFEAIAQSINATRNPNSQIGKLIEAPITEMGKFPKTFQSVLAELKPAEISEPVETPEGVHVFMMETRTDKIVAFRYLTVPFTLSEETIEAARKRAVGLFKKLEAGEEFNTVATEHSDDIETKAKGGDLGVRALTNFPPEIRKVIQGLAAGKHSEPVETETGLHIFKVEERNVPELTELEKQQIVTILRQQRFEKEWTAYTDSLLENAYVKIKSAPAQKIDVKTTK